MPTLLSVTNTELQRYTMSKNRNRILSGGVGAVLLVIAIILQNALPDREKEVQIIVWTLIVVTMAILINHKHFREEWFWKGFLMVSLLHVFVIYSFRQSLPFPSLGVAILVAFPEVLLCQAIFRWLSAR